ncbi:MAG: hypothetical protein Q9208_005538 [Pyrenodesmia sp. 3 TL-2023]
MAAAHVPYRVTTALASNIHCASCVSLIKDVFAGFGEDVLAVSASILSQTVEVYHRKSLTTEDICNALANAAFEVPFLSTTDGRGRTIRESEFRRTPGEHGGEPIEALNAPVGAARSCFPGNSWLEVDRKARHIRNCAACREEEMPLVKPVVAPKQSMTTPSVASERTSSPGHTESGISSLPDPAEQHLATLLISGMTCSACTDGVTEAIRTLPFVSHVEVNLLTHSATIKYTGSEEEAALIVQAVDDKGFDASWQDSESTSGQEEGSPRRSIMFKIDGMYCKHCPPRVVEGLSSRFPDLLSIDQEPTLKTPIMKLTYTPKQGSLTVRDILSAIDGVHEQIKAKVYHPPSLEDRSQVMQRQEQKRLFMRLLLCGLVIIPTFLIGIVWMNVKDSNPTKEYFDKAIWAGNVSRTEWALLFLATPIMFFAADIFHRRAIKEVWAMWRPRSHAPLLRRFYRFGSMNLLISAGTSVAYVSSVALLIHSATMAPVSSSDHSSGHNSSKDGQSSHNPTYFDAVVFLTFFILAGKYLEARTKAETGSAVAGLGKLRPQEATLVLSNSKNRDSDTSTFVTSTTEKISADLLEIGDIVVVPHGSSPPADGMIRSGTSKFDESSLTGESRDVAKSEGDTVCAGTVNTGDPVQVEVTGLGGTSMLDQIIAVVREGQSKRAPVERVVDTVTAYFVPVITALAIITFLVWFGLGQSGRLSATNLENQQGGWAFWSLQFAIAVFVVACPCGIGLAAPTALFVGGGVAVKNGILVRGGGEAFQEASKVDAVVFDKTGTLTEGENPTVTDHLILLEAREPEKVVWSITASLEESSSHPLARALLGHASTFSKAQVTTQAITEEAGHGIRGTFAVPTPNSDTVTAYEAVIGSEAFIKTLDPSLLLNYFISTSLSQWQSQSKSIALLALREVTTTTTPPTTETSSTTERSENQPWILAAMFAVSDPIRPSAIPTISALQARGIPVYMLTGDNPTTAAAVASTLSIPADHVFAGVLPTQKAEKITWLKDNLAPRRDRTTGSFFSSLLPFLHLNKNKDLEQGKAEKATIAFIGDGINDAPALALASVSIAIRNTASANDIALNSASFILTSPSLDAIITLLDLSKKVFRRIKFNFVWAMVYNAVLVPVAAGVFFGVKNRHGEGWRMDPALAAGAMAGSSISVCLSSLALGWEVSGWAGKASRSVRKIVGRGKN